MEIIDKTVLSLPEIKKEIDEMKKREKEINFRAKKVEEYLNTIPKIKSYKELEKELNRLEITRLRDKHIKSIINILPKDLDSLRILLSSDDLTLKQDDLEKIINIVKKHV